jgi:hypothetical protein
MEIGGGVGVDAWVGGLGVLSYLKVLRILLLNRPCFCLVTSQFILILLNLQLLLELHQQFFKTIYTSTHPSFHSVVMK